MVDVADPAGSFKPFLSAAVVAAMLVPEHCGGSPDDVRKEYVDISSGQHPLLNSIVMIRRGKKADKVDENFEE